MKMSNSTNYLNYGSRLKENASSIFEYCLIVSSNSAGPSIKFQYPKNTENLEIEEVIKMSKSFCFPYNTENSCVRGDHFTFNFTDLEGKFQFGFCKLLPDINTCYCIGSSLPWFEIFYKILNYIHELFVKSGFEALDEFLSGIQSRPVPEPHDKIILNESLTFDVPDINSLASIPENRNISEYISSSSKSFMLSLFSSMMNERRIVLTSNNLSTLTACAYSSEALLRPLHWQHIFISVLPPKAIDHLHAPMPFIIGIHSSLMTEVNKILSHDNDIVVANIDEGTIEASSSQDNEIPSEAVAFFKTMIKKQSCSVGNNLSLTYLRLQAKLVGKYRDGLKIYKGEEIVFDEERFYESFKSSSSKDFAKKLSQLQCFKEFIEGRLLMLNGGFGFRDKFEIELNTIDDLAKKYDNYKEWLNSAKKSGNVIISQMKKKAKSNIKNLSNAWRFQHHVTNQINLSRSQTLNEEPRTLRPKRPSSKVDSSER